MKQRIQNIYYLFACLARSLFRGTAKVAPREIRSIAVFHSGKLGDMVCATPIFVAIKRHLPMAEVVVMGNGAYRELLSGNPHVSKYIAFNKGSIEELKYLFKGEKVDCAISVTPDFTALAAMYLAGIKCIVVPHVVGGWSPYETRPYKLLRRLVITAPHKMGNYAPREYLNLLQPLGISASDTNKHIYLNDQENLKAKTFIKDRISGQGILVGMSFSAGNAIKKWGAEKFAQLAVKILEDGNISIIGIGSSGEKRDVEEVIGLVEKMNPALVPRIVNAAGMFSLGELKALIGQFKAFIAVDTGPIYIAEALGVGTIDICGPMDENEQPPRGDRHLVVVPKRERAMLHIMNARIYDRVEALRQINDIGVEQVYEAWKILRARI